MMLHFNSSAHVSGLKESTTPSTVDLLLDFILFYLTVCLYYVTLFIIFMRQYKKKIKVQ